ncbi:MAG: hypothetical protein JWM96_750 [Alphaproteobacteria bacterium]|nr:hypothetical protein [Alphaproteobacteria bacterium]
MINDSCRKISSSGRTIFIKQIPNVIIMAAVVTAIKFMLQGELMDNDIVCFSFLGFGLAYIIFKVGLSSYNLMDAVYDCGDYLLVEKNKEKEKIYLKDIISLITRRSSFQHISQPVDVFVGYETRFGHKFCFYPPFEIQLAPPDSYFEPPYAYDPYMHPSIKIVADRIKARQDAQRKTRAEAGNFEGWNE